MLSLPWVPHLPYAVPLRPGLCYLCFMRTVRFIHAADLHLDAAFAGISREAGPTLSRSLHNATFVALERLIALCLAEKPDFLVLSGDIYNQEDGSLHAQLALRDGCRRLHEAGVRVFIAHGNHDPLTSRVQTLQWPDNVTIFSDTVEAFPVYAHATLPHTHAQPQASPDDLPPPTQPPMAVVHGISHATARETRNLARQFRRAPQQVLQVGVLHCTISSSTDERYAPCSLDDLATTGLDYWALGHIHERQILRQTPLVVYPGNPQGLHIGEEGPRGCLSVTAHADGRLETRFHPLGPVEWKVLVVAIDGLTTLDALEERILDHMREHMDSAGDHMTHGIYRIVLAGRGPLDAMLRGNGILAEQTELLREAARQLPRHGWVKDVSLATRHDVDMDTLRTRPDLLGETLRLAQELAAGDGAAYREALTDLTTNSRLRRLVSNNLFDDAQLAALGDDAVRLCIDMLEAD